MSNAGGAGYEPARYPDHKVCEDDLMADERSSEVAGRPHRYFLGAVCLWVQLRRVGATYIRSTSKMIDRSLLYIGWTIIAVAMIQFAPLTSLVYNPKDVRIVGDEVVLFRSFPMDALGLPRPRISYVETITPLTQSHNGGHSCVDRGGPFPYVRAEAVGAWGISWAKACLSDPLGFHWSAQWTWHVGRVLVGPVQLATTVLAAEDQPEIKPKTYPSDLEFNKGD